MGAWRVLGHGVGNITHWGVIGCLGRACGWWRLWHCHSLRRATRALYIIDADALTALNTSYQVIAPFIVGDAGNLRRHGGADGADAYLLLNGAVLNEQEALNDVRVVLMDTRRDIADRQAQALYQALVGVCLVNRVEIGALDVLHEC